MKIDELNFRPYGFGGRIFIQDGYTVIGEVNGLEYARFICPIQTKKEHKKWLMRHLREVLK